MDFEYPAELAAFQAEVRAFFAEEMAPERTRGQRDPRDLTGYSEAFERALQRRAGERGYLGISVPREHGGGGRPLSYKAVFGFEAAYHDAPAIDTALTLVGSQVLGYADDRQRERYLPRMLAGEVLMSVAYTEPEAGSDLTRIQTSARREGGGFVIDGVKALVTGAHKSEYACLVARTDPDAPPRRGMSMFLVDLRGSGIRVERRETMNRWTLGEIHFESARVPGDALLGEWNRGWPQMAGSLLAERSGMAHMGWATRNLEILCAHARGTELGGRGEVRERLAALRCELATGLHFAKRVMWRQDRGEVPVHEASMAKVYATELLQRIARLGLELLGPEGTLYRGSPSAPYDGLFAWEAIERIHPTLSVGANELQRDAIARAGLSLPGDP
ncbi:MAG: acyl-CoA dehydrogenase family protein [Proteobacteria bacterium]|nr:acyl-CoA dehydrogenase family protein [Pseudomonadota bacterium]